MSWADASRSFFNGLFTEMNAPAQSRVSSLGYDIVTDVTKRKQVNPNNRSEDVELLQAQRQQLVAQSRDSMRNFAIARWAIGKHLDFVSRFSFSCQTRTSFDSDVQKLMDEYANEPKNCDITGRHTLDRIVRMTEARAVLDGDHLLSKLSTGHLQQIETDRLRGLLGNTSDGTNIHGVELDPQGRALSYKVWKRMLFGGYTEPVDIPADQVLFHAYYPNERADQVRGIGLITAGLSDFIDAYEWQDITKAVAKLRTAFGIIFTSNGDDGIGETTEDVPHQVLGPDGQLYTAPYQGKYKVDLGKAPFKLELDPGEDAKFLTDMSPSTQTFEFFKSTIGFALKSLDIPLCFLNVAVSQCYFCRVFECFENGFGTTKTIRQASEGNSFGFSSNFRNRSVCKGRIARVGNWELDNCHARHHGECRSLSFDSLSSSLRRVSFQCPFRHSTARAFSFWSGKDGTPGRTNISSGTSMGSVGRNTLSACRTSQQRREERLSARRQHIKASA